ncbi:hypothetical protein BKA62DRAFT_682818 [Auriculariales sp. MPI-PUGE-AT-0066]|nr:hypothetical protein BKA62DRAFT_682818 [Auriculariales sp. MPI-PUGE-AT-0066]
MLSLAIAALCLVRVTAAAPLVVARAPASIQFKAPQNALATCSAPVTLSWSVTASSEDDDAEKVKPKASLASVVVVSTSGDITRTLVEDPATRSFTWASVDVPPGEYIFTGSPADSSVEINPSEAFAIVAGDSLNCVPAAELAQVSSTSSIPISTSSTLTPTSTSKPVPTSTTAASQTTPEAERAPTETVTSIPLTPSSVGGPTIAAIVVGVLILAAVGFGIYWRRMNRSRELVDIEYVHYPAAVKESRISLEGRRSSDTVVEVRARAPTPVGVLSRTTTKQQLASDLDTTQTQKMLRRL